MKIIIKNLQKKVTIRPTRIKRTVRNVLSRERLPAGTGEITFSFVDDRQIRSLNRKYHKQDRPTDVLAFDLGGGVCGGVCADIVVSTDTALRNAAIFGTTPGSEVILYCVHGLLHILGYDDHSTSDTRLMRRKERCYVD